MGKFKEYINESALSQAKQKVWTAIKNQLNDYNKWIGDDEDSPEMKSYKSKGGQGSVTYYFGDGGAQEFKSFLSEELSNFSAGFKDSSGEEKTVTYDVYGPDKGKNHLTISVYVIE